MLKTFILLATIWNAPTESNRILDVYVLDYGLSATDCTDAVMAGVSSLELDGMTVDLTSAVLSCELDTEGEF